MNRFDLKLMLILFFAMGLSIDANAQIRPPKNAQEFEQIRKVRKRPPVEQLVDNKKDLLGYYQESNRYQAVIQADGFVVNWREENSFAVVWVPKSGQFDRVMILLHGTGGTAYEEVADELNSARQYGYAIVGIQWLDRHFNQYADAFTINRRIDKALKFLQEKYQIKPKTVALCGFSRGSAVAYEVAYRDLQRDQRLKLVIAHSGGIPTDNVVAPGEGNRPGRFYADLTSGKLGTNAYKGLKFFLYAGCQDEQWGATMCKYMQYTNEVLTRTGARVVECIIDPNGKHMGYRTNPAYYNKAIQVFLRE